jgi:hypothetical protein
MDEVVEKEAAFARALNAMSECGLDLQGPMVVRTPMSERVRLLPPERLMRLLALRVLRTIRSARGALDAAAYETWLDAIDASLGRDLELY